MASRSASAARWTARSPGRGTGRSASVIDPTVVMPGAEHPGRRQWWTELVVDRGEQGGVGADQRRVLQRQQRAVRLAALPDPLVGQVHGPGPVHGGGPDLGRRGTVKIAVQP